MSKQLFLMMAITAIVIGISGCPGGSITTPAANNANNAQLSNTTVNSNSPESGNSSNPALNTNSKKKVDMASIKEEIECVSGTDGVSNRVKFAQGKSSTTIKCSVVRGDRDTYILGAKAGQKMSVNVTSLEKNAVFQIENPNGEYLERAGDGDDQTKWTGTLPDAGDYKIIVGGTRGNATYKISVTIK